MLVCLFCMVRMIFSVPWFGAFLPHSRGLENHAKYADHEGAGSGLPVGLPGEPDEEVDPAAAGAGLLFAAHAAALGQKGGELVQLFGQGGPLCLGGGAEAAPDAARLVKADHQALVLHVAAGTRARATLSIRPYRTAPATRQSCHRPADSHILQFGRFACTVAAGRI